MTVTKERIDLVGVSDRTSDFICSVQYKNQLPNIPFDTKFLPYPVDVKAFVPSKSPAFETNHNYEMHIEQDLGIDIDLIDLDRHRADPNVVMVPEDTILLDDDSESDIHIPAKTNRHGKRVSWLRKTCYTSSNTTDKEVPVGSQDRGLESRLKKADVLSYFRGRDSQINLVEKSFKDAQKPIERHPTNSDLKPIEVLPVFPDFELWKHSFAHVVFDSNPVVDGVSSDQQKSFMSKAMIRGMMDSENNQFVGYFVPDKQTHHKISSPNNHDLPDDLAYDLIRDYDWNVNSLANSADSCFFTFHDNIVTYNKLQTYVKLVRRRRSHTNEIISRSKLTVKHRNFTEAELQTQAKRATLLDVFDEDRHDVSQLHSVKIGLGLSSDDEIIPSNVFDGDDDVSSSN